MAGGGVHEHFAAAPALDVGDSDEGEEEVGDAVAGCEEAGHGFAEADGFDEDCGEVVGCYVDSWKRGVVSIRGVCVDEIREDGLTRKLLHGLRSHS